jgi:hypothetical protein
MLTTHPLLVPSLRKRGATPLPQAPLLACSRSTLLYNTKSVIPYYGSYAVATVNTNSTSPCYYGLHRFKARAGKSVLLSKREKQNDRNHLRRARKSKINIT